MGQDEPQLQVISLISKWFILYRDVSAPCPEFMDNSTVILMKGDSPKAIKATSFIRQPINFGLSTQYSLSATISAHIFGAVMISLLFVLPIILIQALVDFESYSLTLYLKPHSRNIHMELIRWLLFFAISFAAVLAADISLSIATLFMKTFSSKKNNISFIANQLRSLRVYFLMFVFGFAASIAAQSILPFLAIKKSSEEEDYIYSWEFYFARLVLCLGFGFFFLLLEKILLRRIAFVYHRTYYRDRIDDNNFSWSVLNELAQKFHLMRDFNKMEGSSSEIENSLDKSNRFFNTGARSSDSFAKKLFEKLSKGKEEIYFSSFKEHLTKEDSIRIFKLIDVNDSSGISLEEMQSFINTLKDERDSLYRSMEDNKHIVRRLDILLLSIFFITFVLFSLSILSIQTGTYVASLGTIFLAISFIFGNVLSTLFKSILFIFLSHPFDVGDKVIPSVICRLF